MTKAEIPIVTTHSQLSEEVISIRTNDQAGAFITEISGGILKFAEAAFPEIDRDKIYAQPNEREPEGRGPHFDVYGTLLDKNFPWLAVYNIAGLAVMNVTELPEDLAKSYFIRYPEPTDEAFEARRDFSSIAFKTPDSKHKILTGTLKPDSGFVLPQKIDGPHIIHDIIPKDQREPGRFIKLVIPSISKATHKRMKDGGYEPLDELMTKVIKGSDNTSHYNMGPGVKNSGPGRMVTGEFPDVLFGDDDNEPSEIRLASRSRDTGRHPCNLD